MSFSTSDKFKSIFATLIRSIKKGSITASVEKIAERIEVCERCDNLVRAKHEWRGCKVCGCAFYKKVSVSGATCPLGKWD